MEEQTTRDAHVNPILLVRIGEIEQQAMVSLSTGRHEKHHEISSAESMALDDMYRGRVRILEQKDDIASPFQHNPEKRDRPWGFELVAYIDEPPTTSRKLK